MTKPGVYFMQGNEACARGAIAAGCRFFTFYPITPAGEIAEQLSELLPRLKGIYAQMEDEIASIGAVIGASWTGTKAMTATSGPGFSLMQENIGYAVMTETPCVIVNVQRAGPSTGIPSLPMQGDIIQARHGSHGEYEIIALAPSSVQEMFDLTLEAFNLSEQYRTPVIVLADEIIGHMREQVTIPESSQLRIIDRRKPKISDEVIAAFLDEEVAPMPVFGMGHSVHVTGSCHDEFGYRNVTDPESIDRLVRALMNKIRKHVNQIARIETRRTKDAEVVVLAYGSCARTAQYVVDEARRHGVKAGFVRLITLWPFAEEKVAEAIGNAKKVVVLENNLGQIVHEVERIIPADSDIAFLAPEVLGTLHDPGYVLRHVLKVVA
jgi:2-oxoglutarate ferredoxin oxidoreductase subunit alpha